MKSYKNIFTTLLGLSLLTVGCSEETTLEGAKEVYITMQPSDITLRMGDTVRISAVVTNLSGKTIDTPIAWSVYDEQVATLLGDSAIVCVNGAQGKSTKLKATLPNGKYGLANISVTTHLAQGVIPIDENGMPCSTKMSYSIPHDSVLFQVKPSYLLYDYVPRYTCQNVEIVEPGITINPKEGTVAVHFASPRTSGEGSITLSIGEETTSQQATCKIVFSPSILATFYGEKYANMPYLGTRPDKSTLSMWFAYENETSMDINTATTVRVAMNISTGAKEDIEAAYDSYRWECVSGSSVVVTEKYEDYVEGQGFDAVLTVRSGMDEGVSEFHCITPDTVLVALFDVRDYVKRYPVEQITVDQEALTLRVGERVMLTTGTIPSTSYAFHKPKVVAENTTLVQVGEYDGNMISIEGLSVGTTQLILTSSNKQLTVPVTVTEGVSNVLWQQGNPRTLFKGQTVTWGVNVRTASGAESNYPVTWISDNTQVATAVPSDHQVSLGTITGIAVGETQIQAEVLGVKSEKARIKVVELPKNTTFQSANMDEYNTGLYTENQEIVLLLAEKVNSGKTFTLYIPHTSTKVVGTYGPDNQIRVRVDGAEALVTEGTIALVETPNGKFSVTMNLTVQVGTDQFVLQAQNLMVDNWL